MKSELQTRMLRLVPVHLERRKKPRVALPFPATVQGTDLSGNVFESATVVDNMCACGLYLRIMSEVPMGSKLLVTVCLNPAAEYDEGALTLEFYGDVKRVERIPGSAFGVAISFASSVLS